ncbi:hypothetical protein CsSME_00006652 [Camellia sinensis var. sinensis]
MQQDTLSPLAGRRGVNILVIPSFMAGRPNIVPTGHHFLPTEQISGRWPFLVADGLYPWPMVFLLTACFACVNRMFCLRRPHVLLAWTAFLCSNSLLAPRAPFTCLCLHCIVMLPTRFALSRIFKHINMHRGNCRHPIFDRPQDLDVTVGTLGDHPCLCSSRVPGGLGCTPRLRISRLDFSVSGFAPNTCVFALKGKEWLVGHSHTPPAVPLHHRPFIGATGSGFLKPMADLVHASCASWNAPTLLPVHEGVFADRHCRVPTGHGLVADNMKPQPMDKFHGRWVFPSADGVLQGSGNLSQDFGSFQRSRAM